MPAPRRAAIYARYSTDLQSDRSIDDQVAVCRHYAARNGLSVTQVYADRARSSSSLMGRDGLLRMMEDARAGRFVTVIVEAIDRISRDQEDLAGIYKRLTFAEVEIMAIHEGKADAIQIGIRGLVGQLFLTDLKQKVRRGMAGVIRDGRHAGGRAYGYRPVPGQPGELAIEPAEAEVIIRIFREYVDGARPREICGGLNADGILPPRGARWNASTINGNAERNYGILINPIYTGRIAWNRVTMVQDPETGRRVSRLNPRDDWQWAEAPHLAIVPEDLWARAQALKAERTKAHATRRDQVPRRPFSGLLRCGCCGGGMSVHDRSGGRIRIRCSTQRESGTCTNDRYFRLDVIESEVIGRLQEQLADPVYLQEYLRVYREERRGAARQIARDRTRADRDLAQVSGQLARLIDLFARGVVDDEGVDQRIADLQQRKAELRATAEAIAAEDHVVELHPNAVEQFQRTIATLSERLAAPSPAFDREVIDALRRAIATITITPGEGRSALVDVRAWLSALTGDPVPKLGGLVVAEGRSGQAPQISVTRFAFAR